MKLKKWIEKGDLQQVKAAPRTLIDLERVINRDLHDSQVTSISTDRRFAIAYNAGLNLANFVIRKNGYRVSARVGHHRVTLMVARELIGRRADESLDFFDICRRKRNRVDYDLANVVSDKEVNELIEKVLEFKLLCGLP